MLVDFGGVLIFIMLGIIFIGISLFLSRLIHPHLPHTEKLSTYECGERPIGSPWIKFNVRFYLIALIFVIFDVEIVFLYPWAVIFKKLGLIAFIEMMIFIGILLVGLAYVWKKGDLEWVKPVKREIETGIK